MTKCDICGKENEDRVTMKVVGFDKYLDVCNKCLYDCADKQDLIKRLKQ